MIIHDLRCPRCEHEIDGFAMRVDEFPPCPKCRKRMTWRPTKLTTDVYATPRVDTINDTGAYSSQRELEKKMAARGFEPAGDKVGGARNESHLHVGKKFSYGGQSKR